jgi:hypothetical protein
VSQIGVVPVQSSWLVAEHCPQAPDASHAGAPALGQARDALDPKSPLHPAHIPLPVSQTGVDPVHEAWSLAEH